MKKFLLSLATVAFAGFSALAVPIVVDFGSSEVLPAQADVASTTPATATISGVELSMLHCYKSSNFLMMNGKVYVDDDAAYLEFKANEPVSSFSIHTGSSASTNVLVTLTCNGNEVGRYVKLKLENQNADFTFEIPEEYQAAGTAYRLTTANKYNAQITVLTLNPDGSAINPDPTPDPTPSETTDLDVANATNIVGATVEEVMKEDGSGVQAAKHVQPLESLEIDGYKFTFASGTNENNAPAYYWPTSTSKNGKISIRLYTGNTMTVTAPEGVEFTSLVSVPDKSSTQTTIYSGDATNAYTFAATATTRINILKVGTGDPVEPDPVVPTETVKIIKATQVVEGSVAFVFEEGYVSTFDSSKTYGYWMATATTMADEMEVAKDAIFTLTSTADGYTIKDAYGRIMGWDGSHWSFNAYENTSDGNCFWDVTMVDGKVKIINKAKSSEGNEVYLAGKPYNKDYEMVPTDRADQTLPTLYIANGGSSVFEVENVEAGETVYYNLQGVKVANPESGLYIRVQGNKAQKVMIRK